MDAKTAHDAMYEFLSLLSGSDRYTEEELVMAGLDHPAEHQMLSFDELFSRIKNLCSVFILEQSELDEEWRATFLQALLVLAAAGKPYVPLMRRARSKCDYLLYLHFDSILNSNAQIYRDTCKKVVTIAKQLVSENRTTLPDFLPPCNLLREYVTTNRLIDWIRRAVIADLIQREWQHTLSDLGRTSLTRFQNSPVGSSTSDQFATSVFTALDRRGIWAKLSDADVTMDEVDGAAAVVCTTLSSIEDGTWEGKFAYFARTGELGPYFGATEEYMHTQPDFEELGQYAWKAQCLYKTGLSVSESLASAKLEVEKATAKSLSARDVLNNFVRAKGLLEWIQPAVITDLIHDEQGHALSDLGQKNLTRFRDSPLGPGTSDHLAKSVYNALDRRGVWSELSDAGVAIDEVDSAAAAVCTSLSSIENGTWEGDFTHFARTGAFGP